MTEKITIEYNKTDEWKVKIKETKTAATISRKAKNVKRQETTSPLY